MKICPQCRTTYTDDTLQFCLQDGTPLAGQTVSENWGESETLVSPRLNRDESQVTRVSTLQPEPKKSNTASVVLLTILGTLLFFGVAGAGAWFYLNREKTEVAQHTNKNIQTNTSNANANRTANSSPSPAGSPKVSPQTSPAATASATPTPPASNFDPKRLEADVKGEIDNWKTTLESGDIDAFMDNYADRLDYYYNSSGVSAGAVRRDKQRAFELFDNFRVKIKNVRVTPDATGEKATAVFDKEWKFEGADDRRNEGKVQAQLQLAKIGGRWLITGEKDLSVYYTR